jgi:hypothetical protein
VADYRHWTANKQVLVTATLECDEQHMLLVRDRLRPKRAERVVAE